MNIASDQAAAAQTDTVLVAAKAGYHVEVFAFLCSTNTAMAFLFESGSTAVMQFFAAANGGIDHPYSGDERFPIFRTVAGDALTYTTGAAGNTFVWVMYRYASATG